MRMTGAVLATVFLLPGAALACAFHGYTPPTSPVDHLLESARIVFAKPRPDNSYQFEPVRAVRGPLGTSDIAYVPENETLRQLDRDPDGSVLFARDSDTDEWREIAYVGEAEREVVEQVLARLADWQSGDQMDRFQFFADLVDHESPTVRSTALRELDQASYGLLRSLDIAMPAEALLRDIEAAEEPDLEPIRILLLGLAGGQTARTALREGLERLSDSSAPEYLGAWATALIEAEGSAGADWVVRHVLKQPDIPIETREQVVGALALHHLYGEAALQTKVAGIVEEAVAREPALAAPVARQFGFHGDWSQAGALGTLVRNRRLPSLNDQMTVIRYIGLASDMGTAAGADATGEQK